MKNSNRKYLSMIISLLLAFGILLMAGCSQRYSEPVMTTQYESYYDDEDASEADLYEEDWEDEETTTTTKTTTAKKTEAKKKDWKQAYTDFVYELEDSYNGIIVYYLCADFTGDGIDDFICSLNKNEYESDKDIAVAYYNGGVATLTSDVGFLGYDSRNKLIGQSTESDGHWSIENDRVKYYKFSNGQFVFAKIDKYGYDLADHQSISGFLKYEMLNEIKKGNDHGFNL